MVPTSPVICFGNKTVKSKLFRAISLISKKDALLEKNNGVGLTSNIEERLDGTDKKLQGFQLLVSKNKKSSESEDGNMDEL